MENKLKKKVNESVDGLANIIKELGKKQKKVSDRVKILEVKIFGQPAATTATSVSQTR